jgi:E3 ubiquitin-protein ligase UBR1
VCPLCKALGSAFFPIIWKAKEEAPICVIQSEVSFESWLANFGPMMRRLGQPVDGEEKGIRKRQEMFVDYGSANIVIPISNMLSQLSTIQPEDWRSRISPSTTQFGSNAPPSTSPTSHIEKLQKAYLRLRDTYLDNDILSDVPIRAPSAELTHCDSLARTLGFSISAIEIAQRGVGSESGQTLLDKISPQTLAGARILAETISSYFAVGALQARESTMTMVQFNVMQNSQLERLFLGHHVYNKKSAGEIARSHEPLLSTDSFLFLAECTLCSIPGLSWDFMNVVRLCYIAEVVKIVVAITRDCDFVQNMKIWEEMGVFGGSDEHFGYTKRQILALRNFIAFIESSLGGERRLGGISHFGIAVMRLLIGQYVTPFLRKTVILVHTKFGVIFSSSGFSELDEPERVRLCKLLQLPHVDEIIELVLNTHDLQSIVDGWCSHLTIKQSRVKLRHPAIFELVGLPKQFDILVEEGMKRRCPTNGTEMTDPCVCLFCGDIFCSQASGCITEIGNETDGFRKIGGCNQHTRQ